MSAVLTSKENPGWAGCVDAVRGFRPRTARQREVLSWWRPVVESTPEVTSRRSPIGHVTVSGVPVSGDGGQVLLCKHPRFGRWGPWGGHVDAGDADVTAALVRELTEEAGDLGWRVAGVVDVWGGMVGCLPDTMVPHLDLLFGVRVDEVRPPTLEAEVRTGAWFDVDALPSPITPGLRRLITRSRRSVTALRSG